ncbi:winged helix-turn-helix transcriptional regulator [Micromonospora sp. NPDC007271]|uniref:helix-turn-helix transcriptional regulator n=1 Tax=Micromonospora sp. NPDC007271 TaxID=3154587 RepID=UPI00340D8407
MLDDLVPLDEAVYRAVIAFPGAGVARLADEVGWPVAVITASLNRLADTGLVHPGPDGAMIASPPELVLGPRLARSREQLRRSEELLAQFAETYHREMAPARGHDLVELIEGPESVAHRLLQLEYSAQRTIRAFQSGANQAIPTADTFEETTSEDLQGKRGQDETDALERVRRHAVAGVVYRIVVDTAFLQEPAATRALQKRLEEGAQVRIADEPLRKIAVADDATAMVQISDHASVMLRWPLAALAGELFEAVWASARPFVVKGTGLDPMDRQILQLMLAGLTDQALAHQLGTSARTVQRRLRALMETTGATTRMQLGWHAYRRGWV